MNSLFFVDTPLQFYNAFLIASDKHERGNQCSVVVYNQFNNAEFLTKAYRSTNAFTNTWLIDSVETNSFKELFVWQMEASFGKQHHRLPNSFYQSLTETKIDEFYLACPTPATMELLTFLHMQESALKTYFYEDGVGTYNGNVFKQPFFFDQPNSSRLKSEKYVNLIRKCLSINKTARCLYKPVQICVKQPSLVQYNPNAKITKLPINTNSIHRLAVLLDTTTQQLFNRNAALFFDVPRTNAEAHGANAIDELIKLCLDNDIACYLRSHPRSTYKSPAASQCIDFSKGMWEIMCHYNNLENALLVSISSTAQIAPFIESGQMPTLLFLYRIAFSPEDKHYQLGEDNLLLAQKAYGTQAQNKIFAPDTLEDARKLIIDFTSKLSD